ncbi:MAG TPA: phosphocarrier protein HPr [Ruminococcaceae bacterium]|jgi:phosphotransferase system HPr (HPr) family protein|nr:HPr family phosphocarrier protein [Oscillospiraceae bacterium]HCA71903.1 phosphocarrier protein HPr [Oscillospiraceae bacterium]HCC02030.1 phosphocarrier protein HPr [Oscillospiraceae bacterium]HCM23057.1 phosphocarrier protein HPr [Oscillospiraceae bacterium]
MIQKQFTIGCKQGFHLRPAQLLTETAGPFASTIMLKKVGTDSEIDAKSILGLMSLGLGAGQEVTVTVTGDDETAAMAAVEKLFANNFGEQ